MNRAAAAENDHCNEPGGAEAAPARREEQPRNSHTDQSRRADLDTAWRAGAASATDRHGHSSGELGHVEPRKGEAPLARQGSTSHTSRETLAVHPQLLLATMLLRLAADKRQRREKSRIDRMTSAKRGVTKRRKAGRRAQRHSKNSRAPNKIVTWRPASQEISGEKGPKRQWGLPIAGNGGMCAEQRADHQAACDGKITWSAYFAKWGPRL